MIVAAAVKRLLFATLLLYAAIALAAAYWAIVGRASILLRDDNPRLIEEAARIRRGSIYGRQGQLLVESVQYNGGMSRSFLRPSTYSLVGYHSLRYGSSGIEAAFNRTLDGSESPATLESFFLREILNMPQEGADLRLTLVADVQDALALAMQDHRGAAIVMDATNGAITAMASFPNYDPNSLDEDWESLVADEGRPFFNRALQGRYQPGASMTTLWLAHAIESDFDLSTAFTEPDAPVELEPDLRFSCAFQPASKAITLTEAFIFGCPAPFLKYHAALSGDSYARIIETFALQAASTLAGFPVAHFGTIVSSERDDTSASGATRGRAVLGQGDLTISPLQMATIMSAIAGDGAVPTAHVLSGIRQPGTEIWQDEQPEQSARVMLKPGTAAKLRAVFQETWRNLLGKSGATGQEVGANIAIARSGEGAQLWLNGFVKPEEQPAVAFVAVLENTDNIEAIIRVGQKLTEAILSL